MAKRRTKAKTVETELTPCDKANAELKAKGYKVEMHPDNFMVLKNTWEYWMRGEVTRDQIYEYLTRLNEVREEFGFAKYKIPNCVSCSFTQNEAKFKEDLRPIYDICMKYYNEPVIISD